MSNALTTFLITGGGVAVSAGLFKIGGMLGSLNSTLEDLGRRVSRLEDHLTKE